MCCVMRRRQADMLSYGCTCMAHRRHRGGGGPPSAHLWFYTIIVHVPRYTINSTILQFDKDFHINLVSVPFGPFLGTFFYIFAFISASHSIAVLVIYI